MKHTLLSICLCVGSILYTQAQENQSVQTSLFGITNLTTGVNIPHNSSSSFLGYACVGDTHQIVLVPQTASPEDAYQTAISVNPQPDVSITNANYPTPVSITFHEAGDYYFLFAPHQSEIPFVIYVFSPDLTIDASNTTIFLGQDIDFSCDEALFTEWDMGDQTTYTDVYEFTHLYQEVGTYNVTLQYDNGPCGTGQEQVVITVLPNDLTIVASDPSPCEYDTLTLSAYCPYEPAVQQWQWHYQGNMVGNQQNLNWFLATDDPQTLTLTTYDADNNVLDQTQYTISGISEAPNLPIINGPALSCQQRDYYLTQVDSQYTYQWQVQNGQIVAIDDDQITVLWQGNDGALSVLVTDPITGCQNTASLPLETCCPQMETADFVIQDGDQSADLIALNNNNATIANKTLVIHGEFSVYYNGISLQHCQVYMAPHSSIKVMTNYIDNNQELTAYQTEFTACMDTMWKGIFVREGHLTLEQCLVEKAQKAVKVIGVGGTPDPININRSYDIRETKFNNNYIHFSQIYQANSQSALYGNVFTSYGALLPPHATLQRPRIGVELIETNGVVIGGQADHPNFFHGADFGVFAVDANATVSHNTFNQLVAPNPLELIDIHGFYILNSVGIFAGRTVKDHFHLSATHNTLWGNRCGIYALGTQLYAADNDVTNHVIGINSIYSPPTPGLSNIANNTFNKTKTAIHSYANMGGFYCTKNDITDSYYGIRTIYSDGYEWIQNNCLQTTHYGIHLSHLQDAQLTKNFFYDIKKSGISMANTKNVAIMNNKLMGQSINQPQSAGIHAYDCLGSQINQNVIQGFEKCTYFTHNNQHTKLTNNLFYNGKYGVYLANNGVIGPQGNDNHTQDNRWPTPYWTDLDHDHLYVDITADGTFSPFYYRCSGAYFMPEYSIGDPFMPTIVVPSAGLPPVVYASAPSNCPGTLGNGEAEAIDNERGVEFELNALDAQALSLAYEPQRYAYQQALTHELSRRPQLLTQRPDLNYYLQTAQSSPLYQREEARQLAKQEQYQQARDKLDQWQESHAIATTSKAVWKLIYQLQEKLLPPTSTSPQQQDSIRTWAALCPYTHGTAVYMARSLARQIDTAWVDYTHDCERSNPIMGARLAQPKALEVFPNPFANRLHLQTRAASIGLYDLLGKRHHYQRLGEAQRVSLTLDDLPVGMYLLKAYDAQGNEIGQEKVLKMRH